MLPQKGANADLFGKATAQVCLEVAPAQQHGGIEDLDSYLLAVVV